MNLQPFTLQIHLPTPLTEYRKDMIVKIKLSDCFCYRENRSRILTAVMPLLNRAVQKSPPLTLFTRSWAKLRDSPGCKSVLLAHIVSDHRNQQPKPYI